MHVELTEKELLSCGLPMYVCSLHEKECPCLRCSIAHATVTWGCALQVTVSTSNSCCCPLQLFRVVAHWVAMRSWSLVRLNTSLERSVEPPLASMCSLDKEKVFPRIANAEITDFNFKRNNTLTCSAICRSLALAVSCPPGTMVSSYRRPSLSLLAANGSGGKAAHSRPGFVPVWCLPEQQSLESDEPLVQTGLSTSFRSRFARSLRVHFRPQGGPRVNRSRSTIDLGVQRRETRAADKLRTNDRHYCFID